MTQSSMKVLDLNQKVTYHIKKIKPQESQRQHERVYYVEYLTAGEGLS